MNVVAFDTVIDGHPISSFIDPDTNRVLDNEPYEFLDETYYLLGDPAPDQGYYSAKAVRIGDKIIRGEAPVHEMRWDVLTPSEYGLSVNENTIIEGTKWGTLTVAQIMAKENCQPISVNGAGSFVPIENDRVKDGLASVRCVQLDDSYHGANGDEIYIYELSYKPVKDKDIKSYMDLPQFTVEFKGETRKYVNSNEMREIDCCDWEHPSKVKENVSVCRVDNRNTNIQKDMGR